MDIIYIYGGLSRARQPFSYWGRAHSSGGGKQVHCYERVKNPDEKLRVYTLYIIRSLLRTCSLTRTAVVCAWRFLHMIGCGIKRARRTSRIYIIHTLLSLSLPRCGGATLEHIGSCQERERETTDFPGVFHLRDFCGEQVLKRGTCPLASILYTHFYMLLEASLALLYTYNRSF